MSIFIVYETIKTLTWAKKHYTNYSTCNLQKYTNVQPGSLQFQLQRPEATLTPKTTQ